MNKLFMVTEPGALPPGVAAQLAANGFTGAVGQAQRLTQGDGSVHLYLGGAGDDLPFWTGARACQKAKGLDAVEFQNPQVLSAAQAEDFSLSWLLESYRFAKYKDATPAARLLGLEPSDRTRALASGIHLVRDLINTPANHMRPGELEEAAQHLAHQFDATFRAISGTDLEDGFPLIHAVGAAAGTGAMAPRLLDMRWGHVGPRLTLVGKGITYDTGGLNLKPGGSMRLMKKDMGGAAHVLGLARMIMDLTLPIQVRVLIPVAENALGAGAFRPGDVLTSRAGLTVEIDNTDAEGRLVLADALTYAGEAEEAANLTLSMATLTGAARVAVGPTIAPYFCNEETLIWKLFEARQQEADPLWPLPLFDAYNTYLSSDIADLVNSGGGPFAGSITAALFLKRFAPLSPWAHFDVYGWNPEAKPGRPKGGAAQGLLSLISYLESWSRG